MLKSESIKEIVTALAKAQTEYTPVEKKRTVNFGQTSYNYADLQDVLTMAMPILSKHGIMITQPVTTNEKGELILFTYLIHTSGEFIGSVYPIRKMQKNQEQGSEITYARRYTLSAILGIHSEEDDDGKAANEANARQQQNQQRPPQNQNKPAPTQGGPRPSPIQPKAQAAPQQTNAPVPQPAAPIQPVITPPPARVGPYRATFGNHQGCLISEIPNLQAYCDDLMDRARTAGKPIQGQVGEFLDEAHKYMIEAGMIDPPPTFDNFQS